MDPDDGDPRSASPSTSSGSRSAIEWTVPLSDLDHPPYVELLKQQRAKLEALAEDDRSLEEIADFLESRAFRYDDPDTLEIQNVIQEFLDVLISETAKRDSHLSDCKVYGVGSHWGGTRVSPRANEFDFMLVFGKSGASVEKREQEEGEGWDEEEEKEEETGAKEATGQQLIKPKGADDGDVKETRERDVGAVAGRAAAESKVAPETGETRNEQDAKTAKTKGDRKPNQKPSKKRKHASTNEDQVQDDARIAREENRKEKEEDEDKVETKEEETEQRGGKDTKDQLETDEEEEAEFDDQDDGVDEGAGGMLDKLSKFQREIEAEESDDNNWVVYVDRSWSPWPVLFDIIDFDIVEESRDGRDWVSPISLRLHVRYLLQDIMANMALPRGLTHGGILSPYYSGLRECVPAATLSLVWREVLHITVDVTIAFPIDKPDGCVPAKQLKAVTTLIDRLGLDPMPLILVPGEENWMLSSSLLEVTTLKRLGRDSAQVRDLRMLKLLCREYLDWGPPDSIVDAAKRYLDDVVTGAPGSLGGLPDQLTWIDDLHLRECVEISMATHEIRLPEIPSKSPLDEGMNFSRMALVIAATHRRHLRQQPTSTAASTHNPQRCSLCTSMLDTIQKHFAIQMTAIYPAISDALLEVGKPFISVQSCYIKYVILWDTLMEGQGLWEGVTLRRRAIFYLKRLADDLALDGSVYHPLLRDKDVFIAPASVNNHFETNQLLAAYSEMADILVQILFHKAEPKCSKDEKSPEREEKTET